MNYSGEIPEQNDFLSEFQQLSVISLTINVCVCLFFVLTKVQGGLPEKAWLTDYQIVQWIHRDDEAAFPRLVTENVVTVGLFCYGLYLLVFTPVIGCPFAGPQIVKNISPCTTSILVPKDLTLIQIAFAINIGKYVYKTCQDFLLQCRTSLFKYLAVHHFVTITCYIVFVHFRQMPLIGIVGLLMEGGNIFADIARIMRKEKIESYSDCYFGILLTDCVSQIFLRVLIPTSMLILALINEIPFSMDSEALMMFFMLVVFYTPTNLYIVFASFRHLRTAILARKVHKFGKSFSISSKGSLQSPGTISMSVLCETSRNAPHPSENEVHIWRNDLNYDRSYSNMNLDFTTYAQRTNISSNARKEGHKPNLNMVLQYSTPNEDNKHDHGMSMEAGQRVLQSKPTFSSLSTNLSAPNLNIRQSEEIERQNEHRILSKMDSNSSQSSVDTVIFNPSSKVKAVAENCKTSRIFEPNIKEPEGSVGAEKSRDNLKAANSGETVGNGTPKFLPKFKRCDISTVCEEYF